MKARLALFRNFTARLWGKREGNFTLRRFLLIYCAFSLLVFFLLAPVYFYTERTVHQAELERCYVRLESGKEALESAVNSLYNLSLSTYADSRFRSLLRNSDVEKLDALMLRELQGVFSGAVVNHSLFDDMGLIVRDDVIFTRKRLFYTNLYYSMYPEYLQCEEMTFAHWLLLLQQYHGKFIPEMHYISDRMNNFDAITFALRWPSDYNNSDCMIYAILRTDQLMGLMADEDVLAEGHLILRDSGGNILAQTENKIGNDSFTELTVKLTADRGSITVQVPERVLGMRLQSVNRLIITYAVSVVVVAMAAVLFFAYHSAKPMRALLSVFKDLEENEEIKEEKIPRLQRDYQVLAQNICSMGNQLAVYRRTLETQRQILCASIWESSLVHGMYSPGEKEKFYTVFPDFPAAWRLAVVRYEGQEALSIEENAAMQVRLCALLSRFAQGAMAENVQSGVAAVLLPGDYQVNGEEWFRCFTEEDVGVQMIACALSDRYEKAEDLHTAYQQALDLVFLPGDMPFVREMKDMPNESIRVPLSILDVEMLYNALRSGSLDVAMHILESCVQELKQDEENTIFWRFAYGQIANTVARLRLENPSRLLHMIIPRYDHAERIRLFEEELPACFRQIGESRSVQNETEGQRIERIIQYIDDHLMDSQLGVTALVNEFKQSAPTLQKMVRNKTGMTLAAYIDERRLALAARMLMESQLSISEISNRCGYGSVNSFYKAFKRRHGMPPSAMQRLNKEDQPEETP